jgi:F-type H+-transporting ATPase subunit b
MYFDLLTLANIELADGFGINTNILETNIINLSVVITVVIYGVGGALTGLLENRKSLIIESFNKADLEYQNIQESLAKAQEFYKEAEAKVSEIKTQGKDKIQNLKTFLVNQAKEDKVRLEAAKENTLRVEQERVYTSIRTSISSRAVQGALVQLQTTLDKDAQLRVLDKTIPSLTSLN